MGKLFNLNSTPQLPDQLAADVTLRRLCGWESLREIPHESQFSRAFAEFADSELPQRLHELLVNPCFEPVHYLWVACSIRST